MKYEIKSIVESACPKCKKNIDYPYPYRNTCSCGWAGERKELLNKITKLYVDTEEVIKFYQHGVEIKQ